jgi:hypothetical protein
MKKTTKPTPDPWNESAAAEDIAPTDQLVDVPIADEEDYAVSKVEDLIPQEAVQPITSDYSIEGLKSDFPNSKELEQFIFDERGVSLKLKGIDPAKKYEIALAVLLNNAVDAKYITGANPYVDNTEIIPEDPIRPIPMKDPKLPNEEPMSVYHDMNVPHPDTEMRAQDAKVKCMFKTYADGSISYEIIGPLEKHAQGEKLDKYGRSRPEKFIWLDPRTGEQAIRYANGQYTRMGQRLRTLMESRKINRNQSVWSVFIDRNFVNFNRDAIENPW